MKVISSIKIVGIFTLGFIVINMIYFYNKGFSIKGLYFLYIITINVIACNFKRPTYQYIISTFLTLLPILFTSDNMVKVSLVGFAALSIFYFRRDLSKGSYGDYYDEFKKSIGVLAGACFISVLSGSFTKIMGVSTPYIVVYLIATFTTLRSLRLVEHSGDLKKLSAINFRYSIIITALALGLSIEFIRDGIIKICGGLYEAFVFVVLLLSKGIFLLIGSGLQYIINKLYSIIASRKPLGVKGDSAGNYNNKLNVNKGYLLNDLTNNRYFQILVFIVIGILVIIFISRLLKKSEGKKQITETCLEEKELIISENRLNKYMTKLISNITRHKSNNEYIRAYYIKFLKMYLHKMLKLEISDTTRDINIKSEGTFNAKELEDFRKVYIASRYGNFIANKEDLAEFKSRLKLIAKSSK